MIQISGGGWNCHCNQVPVAKASSSLIKGDFLQKNVPGCSIMETTTRDCFVPIIAQLAEDFIQEDNLSGMVNIMFD